MIEVDGIAYFPTLAEARKFEQKHAKDFPQSRPVGYELGWAIQTRKGGDYLGTNGKPSLENRDDN